MMKFASRKPGDLELGKVLGSDETYTLPHADRDKHMYVCGSTGVGKSKFLERLIRQDIIDWRRTKAGLLLIDPHGAIYDGLMQWLAGQRIDRPIIPIDLRRDDWIPSYNILRRRAARPSVIVDNFIDAVAHVWGKSGTNETPMFEQWGSATIRALYEKGYSLAEVTHLTDRTALALRRFMTTGLTGQAAKEWAYANELNPTAFDAQIGSTLRRLARFVRAEMFQAILGQTQDSLDLGEAIEKGHIVLISLDRKGAKISRPDADLFATLLLGDLWTAAQERGKPHDARNARRFYVYVDEFSRFVTPTMAEQLAEARGYGLCVTMAQQFPRQLVTQGEYGQRLFNEVMENASTKVIFRLQDTNNLKPLAEQLFFGTIDPDDPKLKIYATRVLAYRKETRRSRTIGSSESQGEASSYSSMSGGGSSESQAFNPESLDPTGMLRAWNDTYAETLGGSASRSTTTSESVTEMTTDVPVLGQELTSVQYRSVEEQVFRAMQRLFLQQDRQCAARLVGKRTPVFLQTLDVHTVWASAERMEQYRQKMIGRWPFYISFAEAMNRIAKREQQLLAAVLAADCAIEPTTARRRVTSRPAAKAAARSLIS